jgi:hypothetical protein
MSAREREHSASSAVSRWIVSGAIPPDSSPDVNRRSGAIGDRGNFEAL